MVLVMLTRQSALSQSGPLFDWAKQRSQITKQIQFAVLDVVCYALLFVLAQLMEQKQLEILPDTEKRDGDISNFCDSPGMAPQLTFGDICNG